MFNSSIDQYVESDVLESSAKSSLSCQSGGQGLVLAEDSTTSYQCLRYGHSYLEHAILIPTSTNNPSQKSVDLLPNQALVASSAAEASFGRRFKNH